jgi:hypothetical protein
MHDCRRLLMHIHSHGTRVVQEKWSSAHAKGAVLVNGDGERPTRNTKVAVACPLIDTKLRLFPMRLIEDEQVCTFTKAPERVFVMRGERSSRLIC